MPAFPHPSPVTETQGQTPTVLAAKLYLLLFPVGHLVFLPVAGAVATGSDALLAVLLLAWVADVLTRPGQLGRLMASVRGEEVAALPGRRTLVGFGMLLLFAFWVGASSRWGYHPGYALAKGAGMGGLALGGLALATSGMGWRRAADWWLAGTGLALFTTVALVVGAPPALQERVFFGGTGVLGLPFLRVSGPFLHPNMLGDYLAVSSFLLWGRWPELRGRARLAGATLGTFIALGLLRTASTAWIGLGISAIVFGRHVTREGRRSLGLVLRVGGVLLAAVTFAGVAFPLDVTVLGMELVTGGIRPAIWRGALFAVFASPVWGVGAAPYLAEAADPLLGGAVSLWDAHNAYLSVVGQFGIIGGLLAGAGLWGILSGGLAPGKGNREMERPRLALILAVVAVAVNAFFMASEDIRHVWVLLGMVGMMPGEGRGDAPNSEGP